MTKKDIIDRVITTRKNVNEGLEGLWQHALAEALMSCLQREKTITAYSLISELEEQSVTGKPATRGKVSEEAIERLRKLL